MGSGGCGKFLLIESVFHSVSKALLYRRRDIVKPRVFLIAPTGVAAININGTAIHSALHIPCRPSFLPLNDKNKTEPRKRYSEVGLVSIDKTSILSNMLLYQIHKLLNEIFAPTQDIPVGGKPDRYQISSVRAKSVFMFNETETTEGFISRNLWWELQLRELYYQVMRRKDDRVFVDLFNRIRIDEIDENIENVLKSRFILAHVIHAHHIFTENVPTYRHNNMLLKQIPGRLISITFKDEVPKNCNISNMSVVQNLMKLTITD